MKGKTMPELLDPHPVFGAIFYNREVGWWENTTGLFIKEWYDNHVYVYADEKGPTEQQTIAFAHVVQNKQAYFKQISERALSLYLEVRDKFLGAWDQETFDRYYPLKTAAEVCLDFSAFGLCVKARDKQGRIPVEFTYNVEWEAEHGIRFIFYDGKLTEAE
jgi:hypothetical protein